ncbi:hypothetical protein NDU88_005016 [Pleurodeles waltl]|uniref:Uncharacterized protein n=1 Tax=Pleurodeles waltl TaxID=8319 RepID=A0AAV7VIR3_PLEWA|nr:hypothetical protein NDU88_005016 [Pleurodeles waltl]
MDNIPYRFPPATLNLSTRGLHTRSRTWERHSSPEMRRGLRVSPPLLVLFVLGEKANSYVRGLNDALVDQYTLSLPSRNSEPVNPWTAYAVPYLGTPCLS